MRVWLATESCTPRSGDQHSEAPLTRLLGAAPLSVSRLTNRLQALGFIERWPCPDSRREVMLSIIHAGRTHLARIRERRDHLLLQTSRRWRTSSTPN